MICRKLEGVVFRVLDFVFLFKLRVYEIVFFLVIGVDFIGSLYVYLESSEIKCYICLFICVVIRVVYLEVVFDLIERSFL